ncbi:hypothetical protein TWF703_009228 [Orbilia oligospora]|uniref:Uncharacterized protein n=1 Tax=Orbilia oligospora TaxID=2813651 RepID=A0A7C8NPX7_ORBOL|nr:hypothetical protein TWF703_009228 [Orbilia oligospora]
MEKNRFRVLLVQSATSDRAGLFKQSSILKAAKEANWIGDEFLYFLEKGTTGSAVVETENHTSFIAQTPKDDLPYFSLALTELNNCRSKSDADWGCILFTDRGIDLENLICNIQFPSDFSAPLPPDFMFLPACLLQWQVQETRDQVNTLSDRILAQDDKLAGRKTEGLENLAAKLLQCFQTIERSASKEEVATYSRKLCQQVRTQNDLSGTLKHDLDTIPGKLKFQHGMIDSQISIMIAKNSEFAATAARKDSSFMRTIAIITLIFLPGTFVAAVFSMSMFNWEADGSVVVSKHIWMYFAITVPLTTVVVISWLIWTIKSEKDYNKKCL